MLGPMLSKPAPAPAKAVVRLLISLDSVYFELMYLGTTSAAATPLLTSEPPPAGARVIGRAAAAAAAPPRTARKAQTYAPTPADLLRSPAAYFRASHTEEWRRQMSARLEGCLSKLEPPSSPTGEPPKSFQVGGAGGATPSQLAQLRVGWCGACALEQSRTLRTLCEASAGLMSGGCWRRGDGGEWSIFNPSTTEAEVAVAGAAAEGVAPPNALLAVWRERILEVRL